eukprot:1485552-Rhodomonas_salina.1
MPSHLRFRTIHASGIRTKSISRIDGRAGSEGILNTSASTSASAYLRPGSFAFPGVSEGAPSLLESKLGRREGVRQGMRVSETAEHVRKGNDSRGFESGALVCKVRVKCWIDVSQLL